MNVYDFDKTIYNGDSTVDFYLYCLRKYPKLATYGVQQGHAILLCIIGKIDTSAMKEGFFSFLKSLQDTETLVESFWDGHQPKIKKWYLKQKESTDLIISASPEFLLVPICRRLGVRPPIATRIDPKCGRMQGRNCKGTEKVRRFLNQFPETEIEQFYSY